MIWISLYVAIGVLLLAYSLSGRECRREVRHWPFARISAFVLATLFAWPVMIFWE
jgi:hypothetical protein